ncbi:hypothetical protein B0T13DRAFT_237553 [Neurospora crassa]|nr:hypothetical protein B0T13DRAFT_237553 [Neurospora crassa]
MRVSIQGLGMCNAIVRCPILILTECLFFQAQPSSAHLPCRHVSKPRNLVSREWLDASTSATAFVLGDLTPSSSVVPPSDISSNHRSNIAWEAAEAEPFDGTVESRGTNNLGADEVRRS